MSGLDEQSTFLICPNCTKNTKWNITTKSRIYVGYVERLWDENRKRRNENGHLRINKDLGVRLAGIIERNPDDWFERFRCSYCSSLFSKWRNKIYYRTILQMAKRLLSKGEYSIAFCWRTTEPRYNWYY